MAIDPKPPYLEMKFDMPPDELKQRFSQLLAIGLYRARLPYIPGDKIRADELEGVATFVIGGLLGMQSQEKVGN